MGLTNISWSQLLEMTYPIGLPSKQTINYKILENGIVFDVTFRYSYLNYTMHETLVYEGSALSNYGELVKVNFSVISHEKEKN